MKARQSISHLTEVLLILAFLSPISQGVNKNLDPVLAPCLDDQAFAVIHLNLTKLDVGAFIDRVTKQTHKQARPEAAKALSTELRALQNQFTTQMNSLLQAGGSDIFLIFSMYDFPRFFAAVPIASDTNETRLLQRVQDTLGKLGGGMLTSRMSNGLILVGRDPTLARLQSVTTVPSQTFASGSRACPPTGVQVVLFPGSDQRRILLEMLPQIPRLSNTGDWATLGTDLSWLALGFDTPPDSSLHLTIHASDAQGASRVLCFVEDLYSLLARNPQIRRMIPEMDEVMARLMPSAQGKQVTLTLGKAATDGIVNDFLAPLLINAQIWASRMACGRHFSDICRGFLIYANDHENKLPPDLESLLGTDRIEEHVLMCPLVKEADSYVYSGAQVTVADVPTVIVIYERANYHGMGRNVGFLDSHIEWVTEDRFQELVKRDNEYRRKKGLPELVLD